MRKKREKLDKQIQDIHSHAPPFLPISVERWFFSSFSKASFSPYTLNSIPPGFSQLWLQQSSHLLNSSPPLNFPFLWIQIKFTIPFPKTVLRTFISFNLWTFLCFHWQTESSLHCTHCIPFPLILQPLKPSTAPTFYRHYRDKSASCQIQGLLCDHPLT